MKANKANGITVNSIYLRGDKTILLFKCTIVVNNRSGYIKTVTFQAIKDNKLLVR
jgi:hypothetical protein